jgi:hypothetical protein
MLLGIRQELGRRLMTRYLKIQKPRQALRRIRNLLTRTQPLLCRLGQLNQSGLSPWLTVKIYKNAKVANEHGRSASSDGYHRDVFFPGTTIMTRHYNEDSEAGTKYGANVDPQY